MSYVFDGYILDPNLYELRRDNQRVPMEPQVFDVLTLLISHRDRIVTKDELMETVWGDKYISEAALNSRVMSARKAIGDTGKDQRLIRTIHGRGYRFVGAVTETDAGAAEPVPEAGPGDTATAVAVAPPPRRAPPVIPGATAPLLLGRETELAVLHDAFEKAAAGTRQVLLIGGEAGLGKTTLVQSWLASLPADAAMVSQGQCLDHRGEGEPYMPVLDALSRLCREDGGQPALEELRRVAPTWLIQMPALLEGDEPEALQRRIVGATRDRMLREIVDCLESLSRDRVVVLVLEDLHWSDLSTLDLISILARRPDAARLLLIGTYRPAEVATGASGFTAMLQELSLRGYCREFRLSSLTREDISAYAEARAGTTLAPHTVENLAHRTGGNPLYMTMVLDAWLATGATPALQGDGLSGEIPSTLRAYIEQRLALLTTEERDLLEAAAAVGREFSAVTVAAAVERPVEEIEAVCEPLARTERFISHRDHDEWPDGTVSEAYRFVHDLYHEVLYETIPVTRKTHLHQRIGAGLEAAYAGEAPEHATELAIHFTRGRVTERAVQYLQLAAEQALRRAADQEALDHLNRALAFLERMAQGRERDEFEVAIRLDLAMALISSEGWDYPGVETNYQRALDLARQLQDEELVSAVLYAFATLYEVCGEYVKSAELMSERLTLQPLTGERAKMESCELLACSEFHRGLFQDALEHSETGISLFEPAHEVQSAFMGENPGIGCYTWASLALWFLGYPERAIAMALTGDELAALPDNRHSTPLARTQAACLYQLCNQPEQVLEMVRSVGDGDGEYGHAYRAAYRKVLTGWAIAMLGEVEAGIGEMRSGIAMSLDSGAQMDHPYYLALLAHGYYEAGKPEEGLAVAEEALDAIKRHRSFFFEAELLRLKAVLLLSRDGDQAGKEARQILDQSLETARRQGARPLQLRAAMDLLKLDRTEGLDESAARKRLSDLLEAYEEGLESPDLVAARALL